MDKQTKQQKATEIRNLIAKVNKLTTELEAAEVSVEILRFVPDLPVCKDEFTPCSAFVVQITSITNY